MNPEIKAAVQGDFNPVAKSVDLRHNISCLCSIGNSVWVACWDGSIQIRDVFTGKVVRYVVAGQTRPLVRSKWYAMSMVAQGHKVWAGCSDGNLRVYSKTHAEQLHFISDLEIGEVTSLVADPAGDYVWAAGTHTDIIQLNSPDGSIARRLDGHLASVRYLAVQAPLYSSNANSVNTNSGSYQGDVLLWSAADEGIRVWSKAGVCLAELQHTMVSTMVYIPSSVLDQQNASRGRAETSHEYRDGISTNASGSDFTSRAGYMWTAGDQGSIFLWDCETRTVVQKSISQHAAGKDYQDLLGACLVGDAVWCVDGSGSVSVYDPRTGNVMSTVNIGLQTVSLCFCAEAEAASAACVWLGTINQGTIAICHHHRHHQSSTASRSVLVSSNQPPIHLPSINGGQPSSSATGAQYGGASVNGNNISDVSINDLRDEINLIKQQLLGRLHPSDFADVNGRDSMLGAAASTPIPAQPTPRAAVKHYTGGIEEKHHSHIAPTPRQFSHSHHHHHNHNHNQPTRNSSSSDQFPHFARQPSASLMHPYSASKHDSVHVRSHQLPHSQPRPRTRHQNQPNIFVSNANTSNLNTPAIRSSQREHAHVFDGKESDHAHASADTTTLPTDHELLHHHQYPASNASLPGISSLGVPPSPGLASTTAPIDSDALIALQGSAAGIGLVNGGGASGGNMQDFNTELSIQRRAIRQLSSRKNNLELAVSRMEEQLFSSSAKSKQLAEENGRLQSTVDKLSTDLRKESHTNTELKENYSTLELTFQNTVTTIDEMKSYRVSLETSVQKQQDTIRSLNTENERLRDSVNNTGHTFKAQASNYAQQYLQLQNFVDNKISDVEKGKRVLQERLTMMDRDNRLLTEKVLELEKDNLSYKKNNEELSSKLISADHRVVRQGDASSRLQTELKKLREELTVKTSRLLQAETAARHMQGTADGRQIVIADLRRSESDLKYQLNDLQSALGRLQDHTRVCETQIAEFKRSGAALKGEQIMLQDQHRITVVRLEEKSNKLKDAEAVIVLHKQQLQDLTEAQNRLRSDVEELNREVSVKSGLLRDLQQKHEDVVRDSQALTQLSEGLQNEKKEFQQSNHELISKNNEVERLIQTQTMAIDQLEKERNALMEGSEALKEEVADRSNQLSDLQTNFDVRISEFTKNYELEMARKEQKLSLVEAELESSKKTIADLQSAIQTEASAISTMSQAKSSAEEEMRALFEAKCQLQASVDTYKKELAKRKDAYEELDSIMKERVQRTESDNNALHDQVKQHAERISQLKRQNTMLQQSVQGMSSKVSSTTQRMSQLEGELESMEDKAEGDGSTIMMLEKLKNSMEKSMMEMEKARDHAEERLRTQNTELDQLRRGKVSWETANVKLKEENQEFHGAIEQLKRDKSKLELGLAELEAACSRMSLHSKAMSPSAKGLSTPRSMRASHNEASFLDMNLGMGVHMGSRAGSPRRTREGAGESTMGGISAASSGTTDSEFEAQMRELFALQRKKIALEQALDREKHERKKIRDTLMHRERELVVAQEKIERQKQRIEKLEDFQQRRGHQTLSEVHHGYGPSHGHGHGQRHDSTRGGGSGKDGHMLDSSMREIKFKLEEHEELQAQLAQCHRDLERLSDEKAALRANVDNLAQQVSDLEQTIADTENKHSEELSERDNEAAHVAMLQRSKSSLLERITEMKRQLDDKKEQIAKLETENKNLHLNSASQSPYAPASSAPWSVNQQKKIEILQEEIQRLQGQNRSLQTDLVRAERSDLSSSSSAAAAAGGGGGGGGGSSAAVSSGAGSDKSTENMRRKNQMLEEAISDQKAIVHQLRTRLSDVEWKKKILDREHTELQEKLKATEERLASKMTECNQLESTVQMMRGNERAKRKLEENAEALNDLIETQRARIRELERMNTGSSHSPSSISSKKKSSKKRR